MIDLVQIRAALLGPWTSIGQENEAKAARRLLHQVPTEELAPLARNLDIAASFTREELRRRGEMKRPETSEGVILNRNTEDPFRTTFGPRRFGPCSKCGWTAVDVTWMNEFTHSEEQLITDGVELGFDAEHFLCRCERCSYRWGEPLEQNK